MNEKKIKEFNENINKEETLFIVSRYQSWITVTPRSKNRKRPLEKLKAVWIFLNLTDEYGGNFKSNAKLDAD